MKRTSIKSVVAQVAMILDDRYWNDTVILENVTRAYRQMNIEQKWEKMVVKLDIADHKATLPSNYKEILQVAYPIAQDNLTQDLNKRWMAMRESSNTIFHQDCTPCTGQLCANNCPHTYSVSDDVLTTSMQDGCVLVAYYGYPVDAAGDSLIPDDETLKEALFHYVLYRYWLQKDLMKEQGADKRVQFHMQMWATLSQKAQNLNLPTVGTLENIRANRARLVAKGNAFDSFFGDLNLNHYNPAV